MASLKSLFGQSESNIKSTCVLAPFFTAEMLKRFDIKTLHKGHPYASGNNDIFTLIYTRIGMPFVGDAVLHLDKTPCENMILFGSCGAVKQTPATDIGSIVTTQKAHDFTSFSKLLEGAQKDFGIWEADKSLVDKLAKNNVKPVNCATFGSFYLEEKYQDLLIQKSVDVIDMECSAFFHAARNIKRRAATVFYVTDILKKQNVFDPLSSESQNKINTSISAAQDIVMNLARILT